MGRTCCSFSCHAVATTRVPVALYVAVSGNYASMGEDSLGYCTCVLAPAFNQSDRPKAARHALIWLIEDLVVCSLL